MDSTQKEHHETRREEGSHYGRQQWYWLGYRKIRERGRTPSDEDSNLETWSTRDRYSRRVREIIDLCLFHNSTGTMGEPEELAKAVIFLASDDSSYINAIELVVDGGATGAPFETPILRG